MTTARARFVIIEDDFAGLDPLVIRAVGPWSDHPTVTNDAEAVVAQLAAKGQLPNGRRLIYFDSDGYPHEIVVVNGRFSHFLRLPAAEGGAR